MFAYVDDGNGGVRELDGVADVEEHPNRDEVCVEFDDGSTEYVETEFVELENNPRRSEPADFGGGESTGVQTL